MLFISDYVFLEESRDYTGKVNLDKFREVFEGYRKLIYEMGKTQFFEDLVEAMDEKEMTVDDSMYLFKLNTDFIASLESESLEMVLSDKVKEKIIHTWMKEYNSYPDMLESLKEKLESIIERKAREEEERLEAEAKAKEEAEAKAKEDAEAALRA